MIIASDVILHGKAQSIRKPRELGHLLITMMLFKELQLQIGRVCHFILALTFSVWSEIYPL
jgi:hypothetical protein